MGNELAGDGAMKFDVDRLAKVMNQAQQLGLIVEDSAGTSADWHPGVWVLMSAMVAYDIDSDAVSRTRGLTTLDALLATARARGFGQCETLRTLLAKGDDSECAMMLARDAMHPVSGDELAAALSRSDVEWHL